MPPYTPVRDFINALRDGETNITRRLKYLVINYSQVPEPVRAAFEAWTPAAAPAIPLLVKNLLKHSGGAAVYGALAADNKLSPDAVDHIDAWDPAQKATVKAWAMAAQNNPAAEIYWELHRDAALGDHAFQDPANPLKITLRTFAGRINLSPSLGVISYT